MSDNDIRDIRERLIRIETSLDFIAKQKEKKEIDDDKRHVECSDRFDTIETYIDKKKEAEKVASESAISKTTLNGFQELVKTSIAIFGALVAAKIFHF